MADERILVVDDEQSVRILFRRVLERAGYQVSEAADARQAQQRYESEGCDLLVTDLDMPLMKGSQLIAWLLSHNPQARFLLLSGSSTPMLPAGWPFLPKPVEPYMLVQKVRTLLSQNL